MALDSDRSTHNLREVYSSLVVEGRVKQMAEAVNARYRNKDLLVICVLKGAFMLFSELVKHLDMPLRTDFVRLASYGCGTESSRAITLGKDVECDLRGQHVLIVEDIVDTGHSMRFLLDAFQARGPKSLALAALVDKPERREVAVDIDFAGFTGAEGFLVGYGMDFAELYRNLPAIHELSFRSE